MYSSILRYPSVIPVLVNEYDVGFHQVMLNEVKNLTISAHEILLPQVRDQALPVGATPGLRPSDYVQRRDD